MEIGSCFRKNKKLIVLISEMHILGYVTNGFQSLSDDAVLN